MLVKCNHNNLGILFMDIRIENKFDEIKTIHL